jgi:hypothetical protein
VTHGVLAVVQEGTSQEKEAAVPRNPAHPGSYRIFPNLTQETVRYLVSPIMLYSRCESPAVIAKGLKESQKGAALPSSVAIQMGREMYRCRDNPSALQDEAAYRSAGLVASASFRQARIFFEQARQVSEEVQPILYYYGALSF